MYSQQVEGSFVYLNDDFDNFTIDSDIKKIYHIINTLFQSYECVNFYCNKNY